MRDRPTTGGTYIRDPATGALTPAAEDAPISPAEAPVVEPEPAEPETLAAELTPARTKKGR